MSQNNKLGRGLEEQMLGVALEKLGCPTELQVNSMLL